MAGTKTAASKAEKVSKKIDEKPVKKERKPRAPTAYNNFIKHFYAEFKISDGEEKPKPKEMIAMAAAEWKKLSVEEKAEYKTPTNSDTDEPAEKPAKKEKAKKPAKEEADEAEEAEEAEEAPAPKKKGKKSKKPAKEGLATSSESEKE